MKKLKVILALLKWLYAEKHPDGVRATVNRRANGQSWFLVEAAVIWIPAEMAEQRAEVVIDGQRYARIGGGEHEGKYIPLGSLSEVFATAEKEQ